VKKPHGHHPNIQKNTYCEKYAVYLIVMGMFKAPRYEKSRRQNFKIIIDEQKKKLKAQQQ